MKHAFLILALVILACSATMADPAGGWGKFNDVKTVVSGGYTAAGYVYDPNGGLGIWREGLDSGIDGFTVTADIEMWMSMAFYANDIYFHIGKDLGANPKVSAFAGGYLSSNNGQWLFVSKPDAKPLEDDITKLYFQHNIFGGSSPGPGSLPVPLPPAPPIPVAWFLKDNSGIERAGAYETGGNGGQLWGVAWLLDDGTAGMHNFTIRCEISPDRYQPDGYYEMDPVLVSSPVI